MRSVTEGLCREMADEIPDLQHYISYVGIISHDQYDDEGGTDGNGWRMVVKEREREEKGKGDAWAP